VLVGVVANHVTVGENAFDKGGFVHETTA